MDLRVPLNDRRFANEFQPKLTYDAIDFSRYEKAGEDKCTCERQESLRNLKTLDKVLVHGRSLRVPVLPSCLRASLS